MEAGGFDLSGAGRAQEAGGFDLSGAGRAQEAGGFDREGAGRAQEAGGFDLGGAWRAQEAEGDLHQRFVDPAFDDADWPEVTVPGHWRVAPGLAASDGPVLYRRRFQAERLPRGRRRFVVLEGVFYYGDVWLDAAYLGTTEGYFSPHAFEVGEQDGSEHVLAVEVACPRELDPGAKRMLTGVFSHWDCLDPTWNPGGLWRPVRLVETGAVRIARLRCLCTEATADRGRLLVAVTLDASSGPLPSRLRAQLSGTGVALDVSRHQTLAAGPNHLRWLLEVDHPPLWWPWRYGAQPLVDLELTVEVDGAPSDARRLRTGFREVRGDGWHFHVNGERLFLMGSNQGPARMDLAGASPDLLGGDIRTAREANLDMVRLHAHVTRPEVYAAADEAGVLLWQDMPLQWTYARGTRRPAVTQARQLVDLVGHHPSVVLWCAHNEPFPGPEVQVSEAGATAPDRPRHSRLQAVASMVLPTWNKDVLDRSIGRALARADPTRPVVPHSGVFPGPAQEGTDSHLYFGWYRGRAADLAPMLRRWPRLGHFVSEFGAQAVPETAGFMEAQRWPHLDWPRLVQRHNLQKEIFDRLVPPDGFATFDDWRAATQEYQAALLQLQVEDLRRLRHRPTGGFLQFCLADGHPAVTWSVLDHERRPKAALAALRAACRSVLPMLDPRTGAVHLANELRRPLPGAVVTVRVDERTWSFGGDLPADALVYAGRVDVPPGATSADVTLTQQEVGSIRNVYGPAVLGFVSPPTPGP